MSLMRMNDLASEILCVFERTLHFMQNIGMLQGFSFSHSDIFFCPSAEKYLKDFIAILEEIKVIVEKLQTLQKQHQSVEVNATSTNTNMVPGDLISATNFIQSSEMFVPEQLITPHVELGNFINPSGLLNSSYMVSEAINEPATESSWVASEEKQEEEPLKEKLDGSSNAIKEQFKCSECGKVLGSKTTLHFHHATHTGQKPFCCEHCGKLFTTNINLAAHLTRQHNLNTESANSCKECGKLFVRKSALEAHLNCHLGIKPWTCEVCNKSFTQKVTRDIHQLTHSNDYKFCCDECGKRFPTRAKLNYHSKMHGEPQFSCHLCDKKFGLKQYLNAHYRTHYFSRPKTAHCRLDTVSNQVEEVENSRLSCGQCSRTFPSQHTLALHAQRHNPLSARFRYAEKRKMAPRQKHPCGECGKEFLLRASLTHHQRQKHSSGLSERQLRPFCCHLCHKSFTLRSKARLHMLTHTQNAQHSCDVCGRLFLRKDSLQRHMSQHKPKKDQLQVVQSHTAETNLKCNQCEKSFRSKAAFTFHMQSHEGKFKHQCNFCGKQFVRKCHYRGHLLTHSTDRPFKCDTCGKEFKNEKNCREHTKRVHASQIISTASAISGEQLSANQIAGSQLTASEMAASQMAIQTLLAGDDATYGQTYDQFQACVQLQ